MGAISPEESRKIRDEIFAETAAAMKRSNITAETLVKSLKQELHAKTSKIVKFKGKVELYPEGSGKKTGRPVLAAGCKVLAQGEKREFAKEGGTGDAIAYDDGDTVIEVREVAWDVRQRARMDAQKLLEMYPVETKRIEFDERTLNAILSGLPAGAAEMVRAAMIEALKESKT